MKKEIIKKKFNIVGNMISDITEKNNIRRIRKVKKIDEEITIDNNYPNISMNGKNSNSVKNNGVNKKTDKIEDFVDIVKNIKPTKKIVKSSKIIPLDKIDVLVVNLNNLQLTKDLITDLEDQINKFFHLTVVDQNSNEIGTNEYLNLIEKKSWISVIRNDVNRDLNRVWNDFYLKSKYKYLSYLNNDLRIPNNFIDDNFKIFQNEENVGIVIHTTNNVKYTNASLKLNYKVLNPPEYQGWDFTIRKDSYELIPENMKIFGGDDMLYAYNKKKGYDVAMAFSSPIIHYKEKTRVKVNDIKNIQKNDARAYWGEIKKNKLEHVVSTMESGLSVKYPPENITLTQNRKCIYTAVIGEYDYLITSNNVKLDDWDYICFTDNKNLKSDFWRVIYIENYGNSTLDNYKLARYIKTNYIKFLSSYDYIIWKDARIMINCNLNTYLNLLQDNDILWMDNPYSKSLEDEMKNILDVKIETEFIINEIRKRYKKENFKCDTGLIASGIMLFRNNNKMIEFFNEWWGEIFKYSYRDQLSVNYVLWKHKEIKYKYISFYDALSPNGYFAPTRRKSKRYTPK